MDTYLCAARDLVVEGMRESQVALSPDLEFHLASTLARYMHRPLAPDHLTIRLMDAAQGRARRGESRRIGDDCLISCAFFSARLVRQGGTVVHYAGVGQTAYAIAGMPEMASGFPDMLDVLQASRPLVEPDPPIRREARGDPPSGKDGAVLILSPRFRH